jgi:hypothetical protein
MEDNLEVANATETGSTEAFNEAAADATKATAKYTTEDIAKARAQEKAKLYPQLEKTQEELAAVKKILEEQQAKEADRAAKRAEREAARAEEKKKLEEDEMSFKKLLKTKEQEWADKLEAERLEREKAFALLEREREFQELSTYRQQRLETERDNIIPELIDLISGNSKDEIEQSILGLKERSAKIFDSVAQVAQQSRKEMVGTRVTSPASGPLDNDSDSRQYSPNDISQMSMADYAKNRAKLLGSAGNNRGQGLFGN